MLKRTLVGDIRQVWWKNPKIDANKLEKYSFFV